MFLQTQLAIMPPILAIRKNAAKPTASKRMRNTGMPGARNAKLLRNFSHGATVTVRSFRKVKHRFIRERGCAAVR